jgi:hypothetical protein
MSKHAKRPQAAGDEQGRRSPRLELNRRLRAIVGSGRLAGLRPSAHVVFAYGIAHADFATAAVYLGARTIAARVGMDRKSIKRGLADLLEAGLLTITTPNTFTRAAVYEITAPPADRGQGCPLTGGTAAPGEGAGLPPEGVQGCPPKHASHASPRSMRGDRPPAAAGGDAPDPKQAARLRALRITRKASGLSAKESSAPKSLSRKG